MAFAIDTSRSGIELGRLYAGVLPDGATLLGSVQRGCCDAGALVRLADGSHAQVTNGSVRGLPPLPELAGMAR
ncbi:MAG: hypothetical protein H7833_15270 [Magnetococcus sp. DMHC-1]|nr:hypothetical protein [Magnetococcales bacterium]